MEKKEWLLKEYQVCAEFRSVSKVQLMKETFPSPRFMLNQLINGKVAYTAKQVKTEWLFLLTTDGLLRHFEILMGFNITDRFATQFSITGPKLLELSGKLGSEGKKQALELKAQSAALKNETSKTFYVGKVKSVTTKNGEPAVIKELTVVYDVGNTCVTMWNDIATRSVTTPQKRICIKNSICDFSTLKRQIVTKVNELDAIEVYGDKSPSI